jgi:hypothetical protein
VLLIRRIRDLLYEQGFTISGARNRLVDSLAPPSDGEHFDTDLPDDHNAVDAGAPVSANGLAVGSLSSAAKSLSDTGSGDEPADEQPVASGHQPVSAQLSGSRVPDAQPHPIPTSAALLRQELELIRDLLDTGGNDQFADILSISVGA